MSEIDRTRRRLLGSAGLTTLATLVGGDILAYAKATEVHTLKTLRWGVVGTGGIANSMAGMIKIADASDLAAVSSRSMTSANTFGDRHNVPNRFDSWQAMIDSDEVDAIYVATPTSVREEICIAAASNGKHVLGEKPFASLPSVNRIIGRVSQ